MNDKLLMIDWELNFWSVVLRSYTIEGNLEDCIRCKLRIEQLLKLYMEVANEESKFESKAA